MDYNNILASLKSDGQALQHVVPPPQATAEWWQQVYPVYCMTAVKQSWPAIHVLRHVKSPPPELADWWWPTVYYGLAMTAVRYDAYALEDVPEVLPGYSLSDATREMWQAQLYPAICREAVKHFGLAIGVVKQQTEEMCLDAVRQNPSALFFIKAPTEEMYRIAGAPIPVQWLQQ